MRDDSPRSPRNRPASTIPVHGHAMIAGRPTLLTVGQAHLQHTEEGGQLWILLGAIPVNHTCFIRLDDVLRLKSSPDLADPAASVERCITH